VIDRTDAELIHTAESDAGAFGELYGPGRNDGGPPAAKWNTWRLTYAKRRWIMPRSRVRRGPFSGRGGLISKGKE